MSEVGKRKRQIYTTRGDNKKVKTKQEYVSSHMKIRVAREALKAGIKDPIKNPNGRVVVTDIFSDDYKNRKCKVLIDGQQWGIKFQYGSRENPIYSPRGFYKNEQTTMDGNKKPLDSPGTKNGILKPKFNAPGQKYHDKQVWDYGQFLLELDEFKEKLIKQNTLDKADQIEKVIGEYKDNNGGSEPDDNQIKAAIGTNWFMEDLDPQMLRIRSNKLKSEMRSIVKTPVYTGDYKKKNPNAVPVPGAYISCLLEHSNPSWTLCNVYYVHGVDKNGELDIEEIGDPDELFGTPFFYYIQATIGNLCSAKKWGFAGRGNDVYITKIGQREKVVGGLKTKARKTKFSISSLGIAKKEDESKKEKKKENVTQTSVNDII